MSASLTSRLIDMVSAWKGEIDSAAAEAPVIGAAFSRSWRVLQVEPSRLLLHDGQGARVEIPDDQPAEDARAAIAGLSSSGPLVLRFASDGFRRSARFPATARAHLRDAVRLALPRLSPLPPEQMVHAIDHASVVETEGRIEAPVALLRRDALDKAMARAEALGLKPVAADLADAEPMAPPSYDLRPGKPRPAAGRSAFKAGLILAAIAALLAGGLALDINLRQQPKIRALAPEGADDPAGLAANAQRRVRMSAAASTQILDDLSLRLPDGAYLQTVQIEGASVRLTGLAWDAQAAFQALEDSPEFLETRYVGDTVQDGASGRERFTIETTHRATDTERGGER